MKHSLHHRTMTLASIVLLLLISAGCAALSVHQILADPSRYRNRDVRVSGAVEESFSLADRGIYRIGDRSGQLWVVSDRGVPRRGARVTVRGTIREGFNLGGFGDRLRLPAGIESGLVMVESSHKASR
ncbi:MAG: hypothetical protein ABL961_03585 [Vicinamibacterales bacterium]